MIFTSTLPVADSGNTTYAVNYAKRYEENKYPIGAKINVHNTKSIYLINHLWRNKFFRFLEFDFLLRLIKNLKEYNFHVANNLVSTCKTKCNWVKTSTDKVHLPQGFTTQARIAEVPSCEQGC